MNDDVNTKTNDVESSKEEKQIGFFGYIKTFFEDHLTIDPPVVDIDKFRNSLSKESFGIFQHILPEDSEKNSIPETENEAEEIKFDWRKLFQKPEEYEYALEDFEYCFGNAVFLGSLSVVAFYNSISDSQRFSKIISTKAIRHRTSLGASILLGATLFYYFNKFCVEENRRIYEYYNIELKK